MSMRKLLSKITMVVTIICLIIGCGTTRKVTNGGMYGYTSVINRQQLDSICVADTLSIAFDGWIPLTFIDYEMNREMYKYMFIKSIEEDNEIIYIVVPTDSLFKITKRITKTE